MVATLMAKLLHWIEEAYFYDCVEETADGILEATRWGWLPALSGVSIARDQAVAEYAQSSRQRV